MADILEIGGDAEAESGVEASAPGVAIALDGARHDPGLRANIAGLLDAQRSLISDQRRHLGAPYRQLGIRQWSERLELALQLAGAATKFTEADRLRPRWGRLHLKWGEALARLGEPAEARAQFAAAATMDLSPADRAALPC